MPNKNAYLLKKISLMGTELCSKISIIHSSGKGHVVLQDIE